MPYVKSIQDFVVLGLLSLVAVACVHDPMRYDRRSRVNEVVVGSINEPDYYEPWGYYYYPDVQVYFHYSSGNYFYLSDDGNWAWARVLPPRYRLNPRTRVQLYIENDRPYLYHDKHVQRYRPGRQHLPTPELDRRERDHNRDWYERQLRIKDKKRITPPYPSARPTPRDSHEREEVRQHQPQPIPQVDRRERDERGDGYRDEKRNEERGDRRNRPQPDVEHTDVIQPPGSARPTPRDSREWDEIRQRQPVPQVDRRQRDERGDNHNRPQPGVEHTDLIQPPGSVRPTLRDSRNREEIRQNQPRSSPQVDRKERDERRQYQPRTQEQKNVASPPGFAKPTQRYRREQDGSSAPIASPPRSVVEQPQKGKSGSDRKPKSERQERESKGKLQQKEKKSKPQEQDEVQGEQEGSDKNNAKKYRGEGDEDRRRY